jgi:glycosyltransferase involved in cell wall biosynthesis
MKKSTLAKLTDRRNLLVLTYAPAGLGHLRITDALYDSLPKSVTPVILGSQDKSIQTLHRLTSIHPVGRAVFEWLQSGPLAHQANRLYRYQLRMNTGVVYAEISRLIDERFEPPRKILVVSTHFGLAHKLAAIKQKLEREKQVSIVLVVLVSDDTFQHIWYVDGADLLVVPSNYIRKKYAAYGKRIGKDVRIEVNPYPLNPQRKKKLGAVRLAEKKRQVNPRSREAIRVSIPISGAAVGMLYFSHLMTALQRKSKRFEFHIVSKDAPFTRNFLAEWKDQPRVYLYVGRKDREVVDLYDTLLDKQVISLEVTKPSEQAFKALLSTGMRGGVILLFCEPVGQQEFDNLNFLQHHGLIPSREVTQELWEMAEHGGGLDHALRKRIFSEARSWRGVRLPWRSQKSAEFIWWLHQSGILARMFSTNLTQRVLDEESRILGPNGVDEFWDLATSVQEHSSLKAGNG